MPVSDSLAAVVQAVAVPLNMFRPKSCAVLFAAAWETLYFDPTIGVSFDSTTVDSLTAALLELDGPEIVSFLALDILDKCTKFCKAEEARSFRGGVGIGGRVGIGGGRISAAARGGATLVTGAGGGGGGVE